MHTDTPKPSPPPSVHDQLRLVRRTVHGIDRRWSARREGGRATRSLPSLLSPLLECAARAGEPGSGTHGARVGRIAEAIARAAGWDRPAAAELRIHGGLHDLGKSAISPAILAKPGSLTAAERRSVELHPGFGYRLLASSIVPLLQRSARVAGEHHERWDGSGYPRGLEGHRIDLRARVVAIADVYEALTSPRPYRDALPAREALQAMLATPGTPFDPELLDRFVAAWTEAGRGHAWEAP